VHTDYFGSSTQRYWAFWQKFNSSLGLWYYLNPMQGIQEMARMERDESTVLRSPVAE